MLIKNKNNFRGMTLVELMIVVSIIAVMSTVFLYNFNSSRTEKNVEMASREVAAAFREAQNYALTGSQGVAGTIPCQYRISWAGSAYTITYRYLDSNNRCNQETVLRTYTLSNGVTFYNSNNFNFSLPHADVSSARVATVRKDTYSYSACISNDGLITNVKGMTCP